jgi:hypothetical protein
MRAEGRVNSISICGSGAEEGLGIGKLADLRGIGGADEAIATSDKYCFFYCRSTMILCCIDVETFGEAGVNQGCRIQVSAYGGGNVEVALKQRACSAHYEILNIYQVRSSNCSTIACSGKIFKARLL